MGNTAGRAAEGSASAWWRSDPSASLQADGGAGCRTCTAPAVYVQPAPATMPMTTSTRWGVMTSRNLKALGAIVLLGGLSTACSGIGPAEPTTTSPSRTSAEADVRSTITQAYVNFWAVGNKAIHDDPATWRTELTVVAADPQLSLMLDNLNRLHSQSKTVYGATQERVTRIDVDGAKATVSDCQDASGTGQADAVTGQRKTVGVPRSPVSGRLERGPDGKWRVAEISYPGGEC
jgi:hypothetical protein